MSGASASGRHAMAASEARRRMVVAAAVERLAVFVLAVATLYLLIGDSPFMRSDVDHSTEISPINRWVWLSLITLAIPILWLRLRASAAQFIAGWPLALLLGWFTLSVRWALDPAASARRVILYLIIAVVFTGVTAALRRPHSAHRVMALCAGIVVTIDLLSWPLVPGIAITPLGFTGMHAQKNVTGEIALFAALTCATCLPTAQERLLRRLLWAFLAIAAIVLVASRSATSLWLGIATMLLLPPLTWLLRGPWSRLLVAASLVVLVPATALFLWVAWCGVAGADPLAPLSEVTFTQRTDLWAFLLQNIQARPWLGAGFGSFWAIDSAVQPSLLSGLWFGQEPDVANQGHNGYLDLAATNGLIGLSLALAVLGRAILLAARHVARGGSPFQLGFLLIVSVHSITESSLFTANSVFGSFFVLAVIQMEAAQMDAAQMDTARIRAD